MLGAGSILAGVFIGAGIGALSTTAMKAGEEISTGNVRSAGERLAYAVFDDSMSWDEKWAYAFDPEQMVADFVTGVVIGEFLDGMMAATQNKLRSIFANYDAAMREAIGSGSKGGSDVVQSKFNKLLNSDYYKNNPGYDCSEIATDFYDTAGQQGKIYRIEGKDGVINGYEYGKVYDFEYHEVYSDGVYIYDPRYQNTPVLKDDYFRALKEINPDGFDVFTIQWEDLWKKIRKNV